MVRRHLEELLAWAPYSRTPDHEPRPEPGPLRSAHAHVRVPVLGPLG